MPKRKLDFGIEKKGSGRGRGVGMLVAMFLLLVEIWVWAFAGRSVRSARVYGGEREVQASQQVYWNDSVESGDVGMN